MTIRADEWVIVIGMALVTFAVRYPMIVLVNRLKMPEIVFRTLRFVPPTVLAAIIVPSALMPTGTVDVSPNNSYLVGALIGMIVAWRTKNLLLTIVIGMVGFLLYRAALGLT